VALENDVIVAPCVPAEILANVVAAGAASVMVAELVPAVTEEMVAATDTGVIATAGDEV
jgi:hypothetical protein